MKFWMRSYVRVAIVFFACLSMQWMEAVEVRISLRNGDVLRGRLISEGDVVLIEHAILGDVEIPKRSVRSIIRPNQNRNEGDAPDQSENEESQASEPWMKDFVRVISFENWSRQFEFGMNLQSGRRDKFDYNARFNVRRRIEKNDFRFEARRYFGESDQGKTTDRYTSNTLFNENSPIFQVSRTVAYSVYSFPVPVVSFYPNYPSVLPGLAYLDGYGFVQRNLIP